MIARDLVIITPDERIDATGLADRASRAASIFSTAQVRAGECVALLMRNSISFLEASLGCRRLGAYCVPINWHSSPDEVLYILVDCDAKLLVADADLLRSLEGRAPCPTIGVPVSGAAATAHNVSMQAAAVPEGVPVWRAYLDAQIPYAGPSTSLTETLIYTSGTTGHPKGVRRQPATPEQAVASDRMRAHVFGMVEGARVLVPAPLYHNAPNLFAHRGAALGALLVLPPRFDAEQMLADIAEHRITHVYAVPAMFKRMLALPPAIRNQYDLSSLQVLLHAGGPCAPELKKAMIAWLGPVIDEYFGSTEAGPITTVSSAEWLQHPGTVGRVIDGAVLRILDDAGNEAAPGTVGEVTTRNPNFPDFTYLNRQADRDALDRHGLLASGDLGYVENGWLYLCDRKRDLVISGGVNIYPAEIEAALLALPGIADCAVFGVPDEEFGEALLALVQLEPGVTLSADAVQGNLRGRIAGYKVPRRIEFRQTLPREESGKLKKRLLREPYWADVERRI